MHKDNLLREATLIKEADKVIKLLWEYVLDNNGHNYDFKHFSDNCVELKDTYVKEAKRIADIIINLKKAVENQLL